MAEINIEKRKSPVWPWILLAVLAIAAVIWWIDDDDPDTFQTEEVAQIDEENNFDANNMQENGQEGNVREYISYIEENGNKITVSHKYSHDALTRLADALEEVATENNAELQNENALKELRDKADQLKETTSSTQHANLLSEASKNAADIIENLKADLPENSTDISDLKDAAESINPNALLTNQKNEVHRFFNESAEVLEAMSANV